MKKSRKAFTLVELLIVIVVIGILAGMMMLYGAEAASSAKAARIIGDMAQIKKAVHLWYLNNHDRVNPDKDDRGVYKVKVKGMAKPQQVSDFISGTGGPEIMAYISNRNKNFKLKSKKNCTTEGEYAVAALADSRLWYVCYNLGTDESSRRLKKKIAARQSSSQLIGAKNINVNGADGVGNATKNPYKDQKYVCMLIFKLGD